MANGPKTGRRANDDERSVARKWVELYRLAERSQDGRHCVNPDAPHEEQTFIDADDPELLLLALADFAEYGTFQTIDPLGIKDLVLRAEYAAQIDAGVRRQDALEVLAEKYCCSTRKIERRLQVNDKA